MLPRNSQHGYFGSPTWDSSRDETPTYKRPPYNAGAAVIAARGCSSTFFLHSTFPVSASTLYTFADWSPKYAASLSRPAGLPRLIAERIPASASKIQWTQPVFASSE